MPVPLLGGTGGGSVHGETFPTQLAACARELKVLPEIDVHAATEYGKSVMMAIAQRRDSKLEARRPRVTEAFHEKPAANLVESAGKNHFVRASSRAAEGEVRKPLDYSPTR